LIYNISEIDTFKVAENASHYIPELRKLALVCNKKFTNNAEFFETVSSNRGLNVRTFCNYQEAVDWLLND